MLRIYYFASIADALGKTDDVLVDDYMGKTAAEVWVLINEQMMPPATKVAVNHEYQAPNYVLSQGDNELAFFPQVTGG